MLKSKEFAFIFLSIFVIVAYGYINPTQGNFDSPDPGVIRDFDGTYYAATTGG